MSRGGNKNYLFIPINIFLSSRKCNFSILPHAELCSVLERLFAARVQLHVQRGRARYVMFSSEGCAEGKTRHG